MVLRITIEEEIALFRKNREEGLSKGLSKEQIKENWDAKLNELRNNL